jgi:high-affinity Fe2+/Pb2+ permease
MACWPANSVGAFFLALLIYDMVKGSFSDLPYHAIVGLILTGLFWIVCAFVGESVSGGILLVPATFLIVFLFAMWLAGRSFQNRGCCMDCADGNGSGNTWRLKPREKPVRPSCTVGLNASPLA